MLQGDFPQGPGAKTLQGSQATLCLHDNVSGPPPHPSRGPLVPALTIGQRSCSGLAHPLTTRQATGNRCIGLDGGGFLNRASELDAGGTSAEAMSAPDSVPPTYAPRKSSCLSPRYGIDNIFGHHKLHVNPTAPSITTLLCPYLLLIIPYFSRIYMTMVARCPHSSWVIPPRSGPLSAWLQLQFFLHRFDATAPSRNPEDRDRRSSRSRLRSFCVPYNWTFKHY